jgi:DNA-binding response OmpR family regulator
MNKDGELRLLVADDEPSMLDIMVRRLGKMGITPDTATDGAQAQALIEQNDYDVIVSDIYMPEVTGLELLKIAKERDHNVQVVIATASATIDNAVDALNNGAFGYLTKPFDHLSVFDKIVTRAMEFRRLLLDNERMAEVQKRRGDMLEEEVTQRIRQLRDRQRDLLNLLTSLPLGVTVVEEGGRVVMSNPQAERWLAEEKTAKEQPIRAFMASVHETDSEPSIEVVVSGRIIRLTAVDILHGTPKKQKVVIIGEMEHEEEGISQGTMVEEAIDRLNEGLMWLAGQHLETKAGNVVKGLVRETVSLGRMMGLDIDDPVFPEVEPPPLFETVFEEEPEPALPSADDSEDDDARLLAALQAGVRPQPNSQETPAPARRGEASEPRAPISEPVIKEERQDEPQRIRRAEAEAKAEHVERIARKEESTGPAAELDEKQIEPARAKDVEPAASERVERPAAPVEERPAPKPARREELPVPASEVKPPPAGQIERPAAAAKERAESKDARREELPVPASEATPPAAGQIERPAAAAKERAVSKDARREEVPTPAKEATPPAKEERKAPVFKSRLLQKAKELESGGWRPEVARPVESGTNGKSHEPDDEAPDDSVLSRLAQVTEDAPKPKPPARQVRSEDSRPAARPAPQAEPVPEDKTPKWAAYEESETGSARPGRGKAVWPPPLPSTFGDEEEEEEPSAEG